MADKIETIDGSLIQHGRHNDRIYLMHLDGGDHEGLIATLDRMAADRGYGKIFAKIPATAWSVFQRSGYVQEARVPGFFKGETDGLFIAKFFSEDRRQPGRPPGVARQGQMAATNGPNRVLPATIAVCSPSDATAMAAFYDRTFESYAFPIHRPEFIRRAMQAHTLYVCARIGTELAALAAAEIDAANRNCEMTDFATMPAYRQMGLASRLLDRLDTEARQRGLNTAYTIARADSSGMNRVFASAGYRYAGRLINNTQIGGRIRSMAVWYKRLQ